MKYKWDQMRHNSQFPTLSFQRTIPTGSRIQGKCRLLRCISSQYHANIPVESIPHHTTQNEFKSKRNSSTSLTVNKNWKLEMWWMSMSRLQNLSPNWRQRHHEQPLGIPGHKRPSLPQRRWNCHTGGCLSRKCSSSKLQPVPGQRESDLEVDQGWHLWDVMKYKWDQMRHNSQFPTPSFQTTIPAGFRANVVYGGAFSATYHANISVESIPGIPHHTTQNGFKSKRISPTTLTVDLIWKSGNAKAEHEQTTKPSKKLATKTPWAATWNPGTGLHPLIADGIPLQKQFTHFTHSQQDLEPGNVKDEHEQTKKLSTFQLTGDKDTMSSHLESRDTRPSLPQRRWNCPTPMELSLKLMLVTETFVFKALASAWPKGKRHGSRSRLKSVR